MIGKIVAYTGSTVPAGYLICDGTAVSRTMYATLYAVIGDTFGSGDGSTTFNLPDLCNRVAIGDSVTHVFGSTGGEASHELDSTEITSHLHSIPAHGHGDNLAFSTPALTHSITTQPAFTYTKIQTSGNTASNTSKSHYTSTKSASMSRATSVGISDHAASACTMSGGVTDCAALTSGDAGGGDPHNNMMPYLALTYLICASE